MPELPDVEVYKRYCRSTSLHHSISGVDLFSERILKNAAREELDQFLIGACFQGVDRHGKYLFLDVDHRGWLCLHFGMTGRLQYYRGDQVPEYTQALFRFQNGYQLALVMPRKLGAIHILEEMDEFIAEKGLGPDVYQEGFSKSTFYDLLSGSRAMIKPHLTNQKVMAGIGNVYSDEILFQAKIYPRKKVKALNFREKERIYQSLQEVLETTIQNQAIPEQFPPTYLTPHREVDAPCPRCGTEIKRVKVSGRSSYFCPFCQK